MNKYYREVWEVAVKSDRHGVTLLLFLAYISKMDGKQNLGSNGLK